MTAQAPERFLASDVPWAMFTAPLSPIIEKHGIDPKRYCRMWMTACHRCYIGTWSIKGGALWLVDFKLLDRVGDDQLGEVPPPPGLAAELAAAIGSASGPVRAEWFSGRLRIAAGRTIAYSTRGWLRWLERERIVHVERGEVVRDRIVDTRRALERCLERRGEDWQIEASMRKNGLALMPYEDEPE